jgi:hypothetical protein
MSLESFALVPLLPLLGSCFKEFALAWAASALVKIIPGKPPVAVYPMCVRQI